MRDDEAGTGGAQTEWDRRLRAMADLAPASRYPAFKEPLALLGLIYVGRRDEVPTDDVAAREPSRLTLGLAEAVENHAMLRGQPFSRHLLSGLTTIDPAVIGGWLEIGMGDWPSEGFPEWFAARLDDLGFADRHDTPSSVCRLLASLVADPSSYASVFDPACGSGGLLAAAAEHIGQPALFGQEISAEAWAWAAMRFLVQGLGNVRLAMGNALTDRAFAGIAPDGGFDLVMSNPPFGMLVDRQTVSQLSRRGGDLLAGATGRVSSETAHVQEIFGSLSATGKASIIVPNGFLSRGGADRKLREALIGHDAVEAVIGLPERLFAGTTIETAILILKRQKPDDRKGHVLFLDARGLGRREGTRMVLDEAAGDRIGTAFRDWRTEVGFSRVVPLEMLKAADFSLSPARHVERTPPPATMSFLDRRSRIVELDERHAALCREYEALRAQLAKPD